MTSRISPVGSGSAAQDVERVTLALSKVLRAKREEATALVSLVEQASAPAREGVGRLLSTRA
ncbi:MAG TPA: hypothetical protein VIL35_13010 [Vicinamibacterales bacterium]